MTNQFERLYLAALVVSTNYISTKEQFQQSLINKKYIEKFQLNKIKTEIKLEEGIDIPLNELEKLSPIVSYNSDNIVIELNCLDKKLIIKDESFDPTKAQFWEIIESMNSLRVSDINALGLNFIARYKLINKKLMLLNNEIATKIKDFELNRTFKLTLIIDYSDYVATYNIQKMIPDGDETTDRVYQIDANLHFDINHKEDIDKLHFLKNLKSQIRDNYYPQFDSKCHEFLAFNQPI